MTRNLADPRDGIPRGGLKAPAETSVSNSPATLNTRLATPRGCYNGSPSVLNDGHK